MSVCIDDTNHKHSNNLHVNPSVSLSVKLSICQLATLYLSLSLFNSTRRHCGPRTENPNWALKVARRCVVDKHESIKPNEMFWPTTKATTIISNTHTQFSSTPTIVHTHTHTYSPVLSYPKCLGKFVQCMVKGICEGCAINSASYQRRLKHVLAFSFYTTRVYVCVYITYICIRS